MKILKQIFTQVNVFFSSKVHKFRSSAQYKKGVQVVQIVIIIGLGAVILPLIAPAHAADEILKHKSRFGSRFGSGQGARVPDTGTQTTGVRLSDSETQITGARLPALKTQTTGAPLPALETPENFWQRVVKPKYANSFKGLKDIYFEQTDRPFQSTNTPNWEDFYTPIYLYKDNGKSFENSISFLVKHKKVLDFYNLGTEHITKLKESVLRTIIDITPNDQKSNVSLRLRFVAQDPFRPRILLSPLIYEKKNLNR